MSPSSETKSDASRTSCPQTPSRHDSHAGSEHSASSITRSNNSSSGKKPAATATATAAAALADDATDADINTRKASPPSAPPEAPPDAHPFLAYARRVRSFTSPFQLNKSRYLLSFASEDAAHQWWELMQAEYPDAVGKEGAQLFSFKSDKVPLRAWRNPKFKHLRDKWSYRQLEDGEKERPSSLSAAPLLSSTAGGGGATAAGGQPAKRGGVGRAPSLPAMPTLRETSSPDLVREGGTPHLEDPFTPVGKVDFAQLSISTFTDRISKSVNQTNSDINALLDGQQESALGLQRMQDAVERMSASLEALSHRQTGHDEAMKQMQVVLEERNNLPLPVEHAPPPQVPDPRPQLEKVQAEVAQNAAQLKTLADGQKAARKGMQKLQATLEATAANQQSLGEQIRRIETATSENANMMKHVTKSQDERFRKLLSAFETHTKQTKEMMALQHNTTSLIREEILTALQKEQGSDAPICDHEVIPPPKKIGRKIIGYVYARGADEQSRSGG